MNPTQTPDFLAKNQFLAFWNILISTLHKGYMCNYFPSILPFIPLSPHPTTFHVHISALIPSEFLCFYLHLFPHFTVWYLIWVSTILAVLTFYKSHFRVLQELNQVLISFNFPSIINTVPEHLSCILISSHTRGEPTWLSWAVLL